MATKTPTKKTKKPIDAVTAGEVQFQTGFVVRKKYLDSDEWAYFAGETDYAYMWTPESAIGGGRGGVAIFSTKEKAENFANHIKEYHEWRKQQGKASGFDVEVTEAHFTEKLAA
jgi:hypothetical protein